MKCAGVINADDEFPWKKGPAAESPLPAEVNQYLDQIVLPYYFQLFEKEDEKEVIERTLEALRELADSLGPGAFANRLPEIVKYITLLLQKKAYCQTNEPAEGEGDELEDVDEDDDDEEEDEEDDGIDHDELILGNTTDLILWTARAMGNEFLPVFQQIGPAL